MVPKTESEAGADRTPIQSASRGGCKQGGVSKDGASKIDQTAEYSKVENQTRKWAMFKQFENQRRAKLEDGAAAKESADEKIQQVAEEAAGKATKTEQEYDKDHTIFTN